MYNVLPLFKSHYSIGRSILTLENDKDKDKTGPDSIFSILKDNKMDTLFLLEDNLSGFLQAYLNSKELKVKLNYGLRLSICGDCEDKSEGSLKKICKYNIFALNAKGYNDLVRIYSHAAKVGFYYYPRTDFKTLRKLWTKNLKLCIPFYDSFIFNNTLGYSSCVPEFDFTEPTFFIEENEVPFDSIVLEKVKSFVGSEYKTLKSKSIYYNLEEDFKTYLTFRCINNRNVLNKPNLDHMCSNTFCFESWKEQNGPNN